MERVWKPNEIDLKSNKRGTEKMNMKTVMTAKVAGIVEKVLYRLVGMISL